MTKQSTITCDSKEGTSFSFGGEIATERQAALSPARLGEKGSADIGTTPISPTSTTQVLELLLEETLETRPLHSSPPCDDDECSLFSFGDLEDDQEELLGLSFIDDEPSDSEEGSKGQ